MYRHDPKGGRPRRGVGTCPQEMEMDSLPLWRDNALNERGDAGTGGAWNAAPGGRPSESGAARPTLPHAAATNGAGNQLADQDKP
jgi:hypothetical protein